MESFYNLGIFFSSSLHWESAVFFDKSLVNFLFLTEEDDLVELLIEGIAADILDNGWEVFSLRHLLEVNSIVRREIFVFWFNACA